MTIFKFSDFQISKFYFLLLCKKGKNDRYEKEDYSKRYQLVSL
jgi:hypothetical protein